MRNLAERGTRERILEVAQTSFGEHGYHGTRLHDIARRVGIQKASLFHYFPSKEDLYRAVMDEGFGETQETIQTVLDTPGTPLDKVRLLVERYVEMVAAHPERTKILLRQSLGDAPVPSRTEDSERVLSAVTALVSEAQAGISRPIDPLGLVLAVVGLVAFFFTSARVLAPAWLGGDASPTDVERVKRLVVEVVDRCLIAGRDQTCLTRPAGVIVPAVASSRG